jgi:outer membrane receptor for ferrienterochelin and colicins
MQRVLIPARDPEQSPSPTDAGSIARSVSRRSASRDSLRKRRLASWMLLFGMFRVSSAAAQQPAQDDLGKQSMEDLVKMNVDSVYGATKFLQKAEDAASSISVVTAEEIQKHGYRTLAEVLKSVSGFYVISDRNYSYVGVRGLSVPGDYNARILFLVDGHRVNENIFDGAYVSTEFPVDIDLVERIEIIRGPDSSAYGTGAFAAVINVITKRGRDLKALEFSAEAGSLNAYKGRMSFGDRFDNGLETLLSENLSRSCAARTTSVKARSSVSATPP